jgi:5-methylcytosine-specific restriction endonuclease McrA
VSQRVARGSTTTRKVTDESRVRRVGFATSIDNDYAHIRKLERCKNSCRTEVFKQGENGGTEIEPKPAELEIPADGNWNELTAQQRWYYKNRQRRIAVKENRRRELHRWFYELKRDQFDCAVCNEGRPPALDFHHTGEKNMAISEMVNDGYAKDSIREEIERCVTLCVNCHRRRHYEGPDPATLPERKEVEAEIQRLSGHEARKKRRRWILAYKRESDGCQYCNESDPVCLEFHHEAKKTAEIGKLISHGHGLSEMQNEIEVCDLVCRNCHRELHFSPPTSDRYDTHK